MTTADSIPLVHDFSGRTVTVMGLGRFGGGLGAAGYALACGAKRLIISDAASPESLAEAVAKLLAVTGEPETDGRLDLRLGGHAPDHVTESDLVIASPAIPAPWTNPILLAAREADVPVTTEISLLTERLDRRQVIGITGSQGKSTTSAMIAHLLSRTGRTVHLGGNIGGSLLTNLSAIEPEDLIVLELSSFMLYWLGAANEWSGGAPWSPRWAVLTNLSPNHLDWHGSLAHYETCKSNIFRFQQEGDVFIRGDDPLVLAEETNEAAAFLKLPGAHNRLNAALACVVATTVLETNPASLAPLLDDFAGLPHRLRFVHEVRGVRCYDDSKSTTPNAALRAVESFPDPKRLHLIAGGYDKGSDLSEIARCAQTLGGLYAIGDTGPALAERAMDLGAMPNRIHLCGTLHQAVVCAMERAVKGDILLLSPGCASWDQFTDFEARGRAFAEAVRTLT